jgi:antitoxin component YwqK of YwqJK toxin-antitoxin module
MLLIISCGNNNKRENKFYTKEGYLVKCEYYSNGKLQNQIIIMDSLKNEYVRLRYYEDGTFKDSMHFENNQLVGKAKTFDKHDSTTCYYEYVAGKQNGEAKCFYFNGTISAYGLFEDDKQIGEWKFFHPNGQLATYQYQNHNGDIIYLRKYDNDGRLLKSMGSGIIKINYPPDTILVGNYIATVTMATPPNCEVELIAGEIDTTTGKVFNTVPCEWKNKGDTITIMKNYSKQYLAVVESPIIYVVKKYNKTGKQYLGCLWKIKDLQTGKTEEGKSFIPVVIVKSKRTDC